MNPYLVYGFTERLNYSLATRMPLAIDTAKHFGTGAAIRQLFNEGDYVMGEGINLAWTRKVDIPNNISALVINPGDRCRFLFEVEQPKKNITLPGGGFVTDKTTGYTIRIYKLAFTKKNKKDMLAVDVEVMPGKGIVANSVEVSAATSPDLPVMNAEAFSPGIEPKATVALIPIAVIVGAISAVLLGIYGYLSLKEVHKIIISPSGFLLIVAAIVLMFPALRAQFTKAVKT